MTDRATHKDVIAAQDPRRTATPGDEAAAVVVVESRDLFAGARTVRIAHAGQTYLLRITRENKLILTK